MRNRTMPPRRRPNPAPIFYLLFPVFYLLASPLHAQEQAALIESHTTQIYSLLEQNRPTDAIPLADALVGILEAHPQLGTIRQAIAFNNLALALQKAQDLTGAEKFYRRALDILRRLPTPDPGGLIIIQKNLAYILLRTGDRTTAIELLSAALEWRREVNGRDDPDFLADLLHLASIHSEAGDYGAAEPLYREALEAQKRTLGTDHPDYLHTLTNTAVVLMYRGKYAEAEPLLREALETTRRTQGADSPNYTVALSNLASLLHGMGDLAGAEPLYREALELKRRAVGEADPSYANTLNALAIILKTRGDYGAAEPLYREALEIYRRTVGTNHSDYAMVLGNLATMLLAAGAYTDSDPLFQEVLEIWRRIVGPNHPRYAATLSDYASLLEARGDYATAEPLYREALEIARRTAGPGSPQYATILNNLAGLLYATGNYEGAEPLYRESLEIRRRTLGSNHPEYATALQNLASLLSNKGDYAAAEQLLREAIEILRRSPGQESPSYARALNNLGLLLNARGDLDGALQFLGESLEIRRHVLGTNHPEYANALTNIGAFLAGKADAAIVEPILREALEIWSRTAGTTHPAYIITLNNLAGLLFKSGRQVDAEPLLMEALEITERVLGKDHSTYRILLTNLAMTNQVLGRPDVALGSIERALEVEQGMLAQIFGFTSERGMLAFTATLRPVLDGLLSLANTQESDDAAKLALQWVLRRKGAVLAAISTYRQIERLATEDPQIAAGVSRLHETSSRLTRLALNPPAGIDADSLTQIVANLSSQRERLEADLSRTLSSRLNDQNAAPAPTTEVDDLRRALPSNGALIEFIRYDQETFGQPGQPYRAPRSHYAALILHAAGPVRWVPLGEAAEIESSIRDLRTAHMGCEGGERSQFCSESNYKAAAEEAYLRIFDPLEPHLEGAEHLIASLDGELNQVPFGALVDLEGRYLIERFRIAYVSSGRDLLRPASRTGASGTTVFAGPTFDLVPTAKASGEAGGAKRGAKPGSRPTATGNARSGGDVVPATAAPEALRGLKWDELPGALAEAGDVQAAIEGTARGPVTIHTAAEATEEAFKATRAPRILHLATHGFFVPERDLTPEERAQCLTAGSGPGAQLDLETGMGRGIERLRCAENPLLRSGIVLAGANAVGTTAATSSGATGTTGVATTTMPQPTPEDGWVLAEEIANLDLAGTELVVLSACETGLGDLKTGEGVYGLRRAFELAGAERILMSLFKVPDSATRELLSGFYRRLANGQTAEEALRESQLELRTKHPHPFFWASFVLVGSGR